MSDKNKPSRKKVVVTKQDDTARKEKLRPTTSRSKSSSKPSLAKYPLLFGWDNYKWILIGIGVIGLGMVLMLGGSMPSPDVWDPDLIYSFRRTVLAPVVIVAGFLIEVYAIFKNS